MTRSIAYIINPVSVKKKRVNLQRYLERRAKKEKIPYLVFSSVASGDYSFLIPVIKKEKITDIVIAGGDGTISQVVGSLMNQDVNFGIIPCGSGNGLAMAAKISKQPARALDIIFKGKASVVDGFFVNERFACMLCGLGFDAKVAHDFADKPRRGLATYARLAIKNFFSMKPYPFQLRVQNEKLETEAYFISIANSNQFGNNFTIAPKASLSDGLLDIVIITGQNKLSFILQTLKQLAGWNRLQPSSLIAQKKGVIYFQTDRLTIINSSQAPLHIDGDPAETNDKLEIRIKEKCFWLIQPA